MKGSSILDHFRELWRSRELIAALVRRHVAIRYRGSVLGYVWSLLNPLCLMLVYTLVFKYYIRFSEVEHYTIFVFCGLLPWLWTSSAMSEGANSVVASGHLVTKSRFSPQVLPLVSICTTLINFILALPILALFIVLSGLELKASMVLLPLLIAAHAAFLYGIVLFLSALNVRYRDVQHLIANLLTFLFFLCPVIYPADIVPEAFRPMMDLNPFALLVSMYHQIVLDGVVPDVWRVLYFSSVTGLLVILGTWVFESRRESFAELL